MGLIASCSASAMDVEIQFFFSKIQRLNASRALEVTIRGERDFMQDTFAPVADILINLIIADYSDFRVSSLRSLELPIITHIGLLNCTNVIITQDDLLFFPKLTMFVMAKSTVTDIENGAFDSLLYLKQLAFDIGYKTDKPLPAAVQKHLRLLHCDCRYGWLRNFLKKHPQLMSSTSVGQIHRFGGILSHAFKSHDLYIPVDCSKPSLIGEDSQNDFSINDNCSSDTNGNKLRS